MSTENHDREEPINTPNGDPWDESCPSSPSDDSPETNERHQETPVRRGVLPGIRPLWLYTGAAATVIILAIVILLVVFLTSRGSSLPPDVMGFVPEDTTRVLKHDVPAVFNDDTPRAAADILEDTYEDLLDEIGIELDEVQALAEVARGDQPSSLLIIAGDLDFDNIRDELYYQYFDEDEYRGYEIWESSDSPLIARAALLGDQKYVLLEMRTNPEALTDVLKALDRDAGLLIHNPDHPLKQAMAKAGDGWFVLAEDNCFRQDIRGCQALAAAYSESDRDAVQVKIAAFFRNENSAERGSDDVEDYIDEFGPPLWGPVTDWDIEEVDEDDEFVVVETTVYYDN